MSIPVYCGLCSLPPGAQGPIDACGQCGIGYHQEDGKFAEYRSPKDGAWVRSLGRSCMAQHLDREHGVRP